jgi:hypothetical protein
MRTAIVVRKGNDVCFSPQSGLKHVTYDSWVWYVFDDRHLYRPKEKVSIKGKRY